VVETGGTEPTWRRASRVLALSDGGRVLMLRGGDPARPGTHIWHTPGGGVEAGEDDRTAAVREFLEETGRSIEVGSLVWDRVLDFSFNFEQIHQYELFFVADVGAEFVPDSGGHNEIEQQYLTGHGWFTPDELRAVGEHDLLAPPDIPDRLEELLRDGPPASVVRVRGAVLP
jgi:8-oxo-dGTP pyrophosphatase MutT (NUDIX family)